MADKWSKLLEKFEGEYSLHKITVINPEPGNEEVEIVYPDGTMLAFRWNYTQWMVMEPLSGPGGIGRTDMPAGMRGED